MLHRYSGQCQVTRKSETDKGDLVSARECSELRTIKHVTVFKFSR